MSDQAEQLTLTAPPAHGLRRRVQPTLLAHDTRGLVPSDGRWHLPLAAEYVRRLGRERWIAVSEMARSFYRVASPTHQTQVRRRLHRVCNVLLDENILLVIDVGPKGMIKACKLYDPRSVEERQLVHARLAGMQRLRLIRSAQMQRALALAECLDQQSDDPPAR